MQRGYGLGGILSGLFRSALPILTRGAKTIGKQALQTGLQMANDALKGQNTPIARQPKKKLTHGVRKKVIKRKGRGRPTISSARKRPKRSLDIFDVKSSSWLLFIRIPQNVPSQSWTSFLCPVRRLV